MRKVLKYAAALTCAVAFAVVMAAPSQAHEWQRDPSYHPYLNAYDYAPGPRGTATFYNSTNHHQCLLSRGNIDYAPCFHHA